MEEYPYPKTSEKAELNLQYTRFFFENQREFNSRFMDVSLFNKQPEFMALNPEEDPRIVWGKESLRAAMQESSEIHEVLPWKSWKNYDNWEAPTDYIQEEIIDILHFLVNLGINFGLEPEDLGPIESFYFDKKDELDEELSNIGYPALYFLNNREKAAITVQTLENFQNEIVRFRLLLPGEHSQNLSFLNYEELIPEYRNMFNTFTKLSLIWGIDEYKLMEVYLNKHEKNIMRQVNGYSWNPDLDVHYT